MRLRRIINEPARKIGATTVQNVADMAAADGVAMLDVLLDLPQYPRWRAPLRRWAALCAFTTPCARRTTRCRWMCL